MSEWVRTIERLPDDDESYLVFHPTRGLLIRVWNCYYSCWDNEDGDDYFCGHLDVTHWMQLPEPPSE